MSNDKKLQDALDNTDQLPDEWFGNEEPTDVVDPVPMGFNISEVQISKMSLKPGETLLVRIYSDQMDDNMTSMLKAQLRSIFPYNRIMLFSLPKGDTMNVDIVAQEEPAEAVGCAAPTSYCDSCSCGKKERIEAAQSRKG